MKKNRIFYFFSIIPLLFIVGIFTLYISKKINSELFFSLFYGTIFSTFNFFLGTISIYFGFEKSNNIFLLVVFGGLVVRLLLMLILIVIALKFLFVTLYSFIFTNFIFYFYYLLIEIFILIHKKKLIIKTNND